MTISNKQCHICEKKKDIDDFFIVPGNSNGNDWYISTACKSCHSHTNKKIMSELDKIFDSNQDSNQEG